MPLPDFIEPTLLSTSRERRRTQSAERVFEAFKTAFETNLNRSANDNGWSVFPGLIEPLARVLNTIPRSPVRSSGTVPKSAVTELVATLEGNADDVTLSHRLPIASIALCGRHSPCMKSASMREPSTVSPRSSAHVWMLCSCRRTTTPVVAMRKHNLG